MNNKTSLIVLVILSAIFGCKDNKQPGKIYMPDMTYSRAYETYAMRDSTKFTSDDSKRGGNNIYYGGKPVVGTIKRGELFPYTQPNDSSGYKMSAMVINPIDSLSAVELAETQRLFNIHCAVCHGDKGVGNGPIGGKIGAVANLTQPLYVSMADGTMFHSITYGKNNMGSYASQLDRKQRWMIVKYIRTLQPKAETAKATTDSTAKKV